MDTGSTTAKRVRVLKFIKSLLEGTSHRNNVPPVLSLEIMSFPDIWEHVPHLPELITVGHGNALTRRLYEIALYDHNVIKEHRIGALRLLETLKDSMESSMTDNPEALEAYRKANAFVEENARRLGVGSLAWLIEEYQIPSDEIVPFIAKLEHRDLLNDFFTTLNPSTAEKLKAELDQYLRTQSQRSNSNRLWSQDDNVLGITALMQDPEGRAEGDQKKVIAELNEEKQWRENWISNWMSTQFITRGTLIEAWSLVNRRISDFSHKPQRWSDLAKYDHSEHPDMQYILEYIRLSLGDALASTHLITGNSVRAARNSLPREVLRFLRFYHLLWPLVILNKAVPAKQVAALCGDDNFYIKYLVNLISQHSIDAGAREQASKKFAEWKATQK